METTTVKVELAQKGDTTTAVVHAEDSAAEGVGSYDCSSETTARRRTDTYEALYMYDWPDHEYRCLDDRYELEFDSFLPECDDEREYRKGELCFIYRPQAGTIMSYRKIDCDCSRTIKLAPLVEQDCSARGEDGENVELTELSYGVLAQRLRRYVAAATDFSEMIGKALRRRPRDYQAGGDGTSLFTVIESYDRTVRANCSEITPNEKGVMKCGRITLERRTEEGTMQVTSSADAIHPAMKGAFMAFNRYLKRLPKK